MRLHLLAATPLLLVGGMLAGLAQAQGQSPGNALHVDARELNRSDESSNLPTGAGEASTMTDGVPNLLASNPQPGEMGIQSRLTVRPAQRPVAARPGTAVMGGPAARAAAPKD